MTERFTIAGSTLSLLNVGEQGVVTRIASLDTTIAQQLKSMGVVPGVSVLLEQRSPQWVIQVGKSRFVLCKSLAQAIYLRLHTPPRSNQFNPLNQIAIACFNKITKRKTCSPNSPFPVAASR